MVSHHCQQTDPNVELDMSLQRNIHNRRPQCWVLWISLSDDSTFPQNKVPPSYCKSSKGNSEPGQTALDWPCSNLRPPVQTGAIVYHVGSITGALQMGFGAMQKSMPENISFLLVHFGVTAPTIWK